MNYALKNTARYSGQTSLTVILAYITRFKLNRDVLIVSESINRYASMFKEIAVFIKDSRSQTLRSQSMRSNAILQLKGSFDTLRPYCISISDGIYFMPFDLSANGAESLIKLAEKMSRSKIAVIYDINNKTSFNNIHRYMNIVSYIVDPYDNKRASSISNLIGSKNTDNSPNKDSDSLIFNRCDRNSINGFCEVESVRQLANTIVYFPEIYDLENTMLSHKINDLMLNILNKKPENVEFYNPVNNLYKAATGGA